MIPLQHTGSYTLTDSSSSHALRPKELLHTQSKVDMPHPVSRRFVTVATGLALVAMCISLYLAWVGLSSSKVVGCDGGVFDCSHVLTSRWSLVAGIPVSIPSVGLYIGVLTCLVLIRSHHVATRAIAWNILTILSIAAALTAIWFISLQLFSVGKLCPYCLAVHGCGIALAAFVVYQSKIGILRNCQLAAVSAVLVAGLITTQALSEAPATFVIETAEPATTQEPGATKASSDVFAAPMEEAPIEEAPIEEAPMEGTPLGSTSPMMLNPIWSLMGVVMAPQETTTQSTQAESKPRRTVPVNNGRKRLDVAQWPLWGNANSEKVVVEMFDYTCSHCRSTHASIREASNQLGGDFAVIALPVPLHAACNDTVTVNNPERIDACEIARIAIAVWIVDSTQFTAFHDWLFEQPRTAAEARQQAGTVVDAGSLAATLAKGTPGKYIERNVQLYKEAGSGTIPKLSFPTTTVVGEVGSGATIAGMVRQYLGQQ